MPLSFRNDVMVNAHEGFSAFAFSVAQAVLVTTGLVFLGSVCYEISQNLGFSGMRLYVISALMSLMVFAATVYFFSSGKTGKNGFLSVYIFFIIASILGVRGFEKYVFKAPVLSYTQYLTLKVLSPTPETASTTPNNRDGTRLRPSPPPPPSEARLPPPPPSYSPRQKRDYDYDDDGLPARSTY